MTISALVVLPAAVLARPRPAGEQSPDGLPGQPAIQPPRPPAPAAGQRLGNAAAALGVLILLSLPWLIPSLLRPMYADPAGVAAFACRADTPFGAFCRLLMLGGACDCQ